MMSRSCAGRSDRKRRALLTSVRCSWAQWSEGCSTKSSRIRLEIGVRHERPGTVPASMSCAKAAVVKALVVLPP